MTQEEKDFCYTKFHPIKTIKKTRSKNKKRRLIMANWAWMPDDDKLTNWDGDINNYAAMITGDNYWDMFNGLNIGQEELNEFLNEFWEE